MLPQYFFNPVYYREVLRRAAPVFIGMASVTLIINVDMFFIGKLGKEMVVAAALGNWIYWAIWFTLAAVETGVRVIVSRRFGERNHPDCGQTVDLALIFSLLSGAVALLFFHRFAPWIILIDLDDDDDCAPPYRKSCLPRPAPYMCFRVAVREIESWLLADRERLAKFLSVRVSRIPLDLEKLDSPKSTMVEIARHSRRRGIREDMVPRPGSGRKVGPAYTSQLIEFAGDSKRGWRPTVAAKTSDSLNRCVRCLLRLIGVAE